MRIMSFSKRWDKLSQPEFITFHFQRKNKDWQVGEVVQVYYKNRTLQREKQGEAEIISKEIRKIATAHEQYCPTEEEARAAGFDNLFEMNTWFRKMYGSRIFREPINKLTLRWASP